MFSILFRHIKLLLSAILTWFSMSLYAVVIYNTDFVASPPNATTTTAKGNFTTDMPTWGTGYSSAYLTSGSAGACTFMFTKAIDLTKYKDVQILIDYGSASNRPLLVDVNGDGDVSVHTMTSAEKSTVIHTSMNTSATSITSVSVHSSGGGAVYFFHLAIIGTPLTQENELKWSNGLADGAIVTKALSDGSVTYTASANLSSGAITYSSNDPSVATVDANGKVTFLKTGSTTITATQAATALYKSTSIRYKLTINTLDCSGKSISWSTTSKTLKLPGDSYKYNGKTYTVPGVYTDTTEWYDGGCPKKIYVITINADTTATICEGSSFYWDRTGKTYNAKGTYETITTNVEIPEKGTYSYTVRLKIAISGKATSSITKAKITKGERYIWFGKEYTEQSTYTDTIPNQSGCDSIGTLILGVCEAAPDTITTKIIINEGTYYYWKYTETKYDQSTNVIKDTSNEYGCPMVMRLELTVQILSAADTAHSMCEGDMFEWRGLTITEAGKYTAQDGSNKTIHIGVLPQPGVNACEDKTVYLGQSPQLSASGADYYEWWPVDSLGKSCLSSTWDSKPVATPLVSTTYHVKSYNSVDQNSVMNGNFELGNSGAASGKTNDEYLPKDAIGTYTTHLWYTRKHKIGDKTRKFGTHMISHWSGELFDSDDKFPDHTKGDGTGWYMVVDGFNRKDTPNDSIIWQQTVDVTPGLNYVFSAWFVTLNNKSSLAKLQFCVNGQPLGSVRQSPHNLKEWARYYELWANKDNVTKATLTITNLNPDGDGNDFGLDDISFQALGPCFGEDSVQVTINFDIHLYPQQDDPNTIDTRTNAQVDSLAQKGVEQYETTFVNQTMPVGGSTVTTFNYGTGYYSFGDQLTITAHDGEDDCFGFAGWADGETSPTRTYIVGVDDVSTITPVYGKKIHTIRVVSSNGGQGKVGGQINSKRTE